MDDRVETTQKLIRERQLASLRLRAALTQTTIYTTRLKGLSDEDDAVFEALADAMHRITVGMETSACVVESANQQLESLADDKL